MWRFELAAKRPDHKGYEAKSGVSTGTDFCWGGSKSRQISYKNDASVCVQGFQEIDPQVLRRHDERAVIIAV
jgi:hypothetical protein